ncbi:MAG: hypothetical protein ACRDTE_08130 [Pseudonocardiaceae bacterium]
MARCNVSPITCAAATGVPNSRVATVATSRRRSASLPSLVIVAEVPARPLVPVGQALLDVPDPQVVDLGETRGERLVVGEQLLVDLEYVHAPATPRDLAPRSGRLLLVGGIECSGTQRHSRAVHGGVGRHGG